MYVIEITEDKVDNLLENMSKGLQYFNDAVSCLEEMKEDSSYGERNRKHYDDEYRYEERYGNRGSARSNSRYSMRGGSGRYDRY